MISLLSVDPDGETGRGWARMCWTSGKTQRMAESSQRHCGHNHTCQRKFDLYLQGTSGCVPSCWKASSLGLISKELRSHHLSLSSSATGLLNLPQSVTVLQCPQKETALVWSCSRKEFLSHNWGVNCACESHEPISIQEPSVGLTLFVHISSDFIHLCSDRCMWNQSRKNIRECWHMFCMEALLFLIDISARTRWWWNHGQWDISGVEKPSSQFNIVL